MSNVQIFFPCVNIQLWGGCDLKMDTFKNNDHSKIYIYVAWGSFLDRTKSHKVDLFLYKCIIQVSCTLVKVFNYLQDNGPSIFQCLS